ncbi:hypothetical protein M1278_03880 [Candidatus Marsarchaeota archaeon]|nr:hypothetical protein [Candidatus Marsarchaeota archaeon]
MAKKNKNAVFILEFLGSLVFLWLAFTSTGGFLNSQWNNGAGSLWLPVLYAGAVIGAVGLFLVSFSHLIGINHEMVSHGAMSMTLVAGGSLVALTYGSLSLFIPALIGFVIAFIGSGLSYDK